MLSKTYPKKAKKEFVEKNTDVYNLIVTRSYIFSYCMLCISKITINSLLPILSGTIINKEDLKNTLDSLIMYLAIICEEENLEFKILEEKPKKHLGQSISILCNIAADQVIGIETEHLDTKVKAMKSALYWLKQLADKYSITLTCEQ